MSDIMETNDDNSPVCDGLKEVFHMDPIDDSIRSIGGEEGGEDKIDLAKLF